MRNKAIVITLLLAACTNGYTAADAEFIKAYQEASGGKYKVGKPYEIKGITYAPQHEPNYDKMGVASWYGPGFHGKKTANGERFNTHELTAAHPTLPIPSIVEVTNLDNGRAVKVRINDRGPFASDRIIDLSKAAAENLDIVRAGTANVRVKLLPEETLDYFVASNIMD